MLDREGPRHAVSEAFAIASTTEPEWQTIHDNLVALSAEASELDWKLGCELLRAKRARCHVHFGYGSVLEYADRMLGWVAHTAKERLRVAESLEALPRTSEALRTGALSWSAVRELTRVATRETEKKWLDAARNLRVREVEQLVRGRRPGDSPGDPPDPTGERHILRMEVSAETYAMFREAVAALQRKSEGPLDHDAILMLMAREVLAGPSDEGRANYQIALTTCERCGQTWQEGNGELVPVSDAAREKAECDAQHIGNVNAATPERASQTIPPANRRLVMRRHAGTCGIPGCHHATFVDVHHTEPRAEGGGPDPDRLIVLCSLCRERHNEHYAASRIMPRRH